jgi:hypothetical protein
MGTDVTHARCAYLFSWYMSLHVYWLLDAGNMSRRAASAAWWSHKNFAGNDLSLKANQRIRRNDPIFVRAHQKLASRAYSALSVTH